MLVALRAQYHINCRTKPVFPCSDGPSKLLGASAPDLSAVTPEQARARGGKPFTARALHGGGSWHAVAIPLDDGSRHDGGRYAVSTTSMPPCTD